MLRLAWHDAGTYDAKTKSGGPNGSIRNAEEYKHGSNNGLKIAIDLCEEVKAKHPRISYADLYQDEEAFFKDYAASNKKLPELGFTPSSSCVGVTVKNTTLLAQSAVGVNREEHNIISTKCCWGCSCCSWLSC